jgi:hypothetical protein
MSQVKSSYQIRGLENALKELRKVQPETVKTFRKDARRIAAPAVKKTKEEFRWQASVASSYTPDKPGGRRANTADLLPLPGMSRGLLLKGRSATKWIPSKIVGGIGLRVGGGSKRARGYRNYPMFAIVQRNAAGAIYDMAGKHNGAYNPEKQFEESLEATQNPHKSTPGTGPSRYMWPGAEASVPEMQAQMLELVRRLEKQINRRIVRR